MSVFVDRFKFIIDVFAFIGFIRFIGLVWFTAARAFDKYSDNGYTLLGIRKRNRVFRYANIVCFTVNGYCAFVSVLRKRSVSYVRSVSQRASAIFEKRNRITLHLLFCLLFNHFRKCFHILIFAFDGNGRESVRIAGNVEFISV